MTKPQVPAIDGWFTFEGDRATLLGLRDPATGTYFFPREPAVSRPPRTGGELEEVTLSSRGTLWSFTTNHYAPPEPYVAPDPFEPYTVAAVELAEEQMVVLGQLDERTDAAELRVGDPMELTAGTLYEDDEQIYVTWKWKKAP